MPSIESLQSHIIYDNPAPLARSRHAFFPGVIQLPSGELLALFVIGEAFESADQTVYVSRSSDLGHTWKLQGPLYDKQTDPYPTSDYLKPQILQNGKLIALGYRFRRDNREERIAIEKTNGVLLGDNIKSFSTDEGHSWTIPEVMPHSYPELLEIPSRPLQLRSGDIVATAGFFKMPDGSNPSGGSGILLRSKDGGETWDDKVHFFETPGGRINAYEHNIVEMQPGGLVTICWAYDADAGKSLPNQVTVSHDNGYTWSKPINTRNMGQSSNLLWLRGELLLSIHCHREQDAGLYVRMIDFTGDRWNVLAEECIWGGSMPRQARDGQKFSQLMTALRFGQASLLRLNNGEMLATHWAIEDGQGRILSHRLRVSE